EIRRILPSLPVVILTGHAGRDREAELLARGAAGFLLKPPSIPELIDLIGRVVPDSTFLARPPLAWRDRPSGSASGGRFRFRFGAPRSGQGRPDRALPLAEPARC